MLIVITTIIAIPVIAVININNVIIVLLWKQVLRVRQVEWEETPWLGLRSLRLNSPGKRWRWVDKAHAGTVITASKSSQLQKSGSGWCKLVSKWKCLYCFVCLMFMLPRYNIDSICCYRDDNIRMQQQESHRDVSWSPRGRVCSGDQVVCGYNHWPHLKWWFHQGWILSSGSKDDNDSEYKPPWWFCRPLTSGRPSPAEPPLSGPEPELYLKRWWLGW